MIRIILLSLFLIGCNKLPPCDCGNDLTQKYNFETHGWEYFCDTKVACIEGGGK